MLLAFCETPQFWFRTLFLYSHRGGGTGSRAGSDVHWRCAYTVIMNQHSGVCMDITVALWSTWRSGGEQKCQSIWKNPVHSVIHIQYSHISCSVAFAYSSCSSHQHRSSQFPVQKENSIIDAFPPSFVGSKTNPDSFMTARVN